MAFERSTPRQAARSVFDVVAGLGPLQRHLDGPTLAEIWIDNLAGHSSQKSGRWELTTCILNDWDVGDLVERMLKTTSRRSTSPRRSATLNSTAILIEAVTLRSCQGRPGLAESSSRSRRGGAV